MILNQEGFIQVILLWLSINLTTLIIAYTFNNPNLVLGKGKNGSINPIFLVINFPWLLLTWAIFKIQIFLSKENFADQIKGTNIWISRRPTSKEKLESFELVIDLTAEFLKDKTNNYICYPNLDGHSLKSLPSIENFNPDQKTLIHCANGHGRSALFTAIILKEGKVTKSIKEALDLILESRVLAKPNRDQTNWIIKRDRLTNGST
tara:strand:- start:1594 stop:2211 length:618 start_codon:yes stop_codon:yes gene_type:complete